MRESKTKQTLTEALRAAIERSETSHYQIAKRAGIHPVSLYKFTKGHTLRLDKANALAHFLGLYLVTMPPSPPWKSSLTLSDALRAAIEQSGISRYRIARDTGLEQAALCRFVSNKRFLRLDNADKLAEYFGLRLTPDPDTVPPENSARPILAKRKVK